MFLVLEALPRDIDPTKTLVWNQLKVLQLFCVHHNYMESNIIPYKDVVKYALAVSVALH